MSALLEWKAIQEGAMSSLLTLSPNGLSVGLRPECRPYGVTEVAGVRGRLHLL